MRYLISTLYFIFHFSYHSPVNFVFCLPFLMFCCTRNLVSQFFLHSLVLSCRTLGIVAMRLCLISEVSSCMFGAGEGYGEKVSSS